MFLWDIAIARGFADDGAVFTFDQGVVIGLPRPRLGELDAQLLLQLATSSLMYSEPESK